jgi:16S rRNA (guanine(1405)-N(7))-methyltransferase
MTTEKLDALVAKLAGAKKYRAIGVSEDTVRDILITELERQPNEKAAIQSAKRKLHEVMALYLGDPDYEQALHDLEAAFASGETDAIKATCAEIMAVHDSTRERLPLLDTFYARIFAITGTPDVVLDIACALNPLAIPWMGLPENTRYYAYDIHQQRVDFLNAYFALQGMAGGAFNRDILVQYPEESGDMAFLLKEIHRMEKRRKGIVLPLLDALDVRWIVLSSPTKSRTGRRTMKDTYQRQVHGILADRTWPITEIEFENELVYCVDKSS